LLGWAGLLLAGLLLGVVFAVWSDALRTLAPGLGPALGPYLLRDGAPTSLFVLLMSLAVGLALLSGWLADGERYLATLVGVAPLVPSVAAAAVLALYLLAADGSWFQGQALFVGTGVALSGWAFGGVAFRWLATADTAQVRSYGELVQRTRSLVTRLRTLAPAPDPAGPPEATASGITPEHEAAEIAAAVAQSDLYASILRAELGIDGPPASGLRFVVATGYTNLWRALHRAEEALIGFEPEGATIAGAQRDRLRLEGSSIARRKDLIGALKAAVGNLGKVAADYPDLGGDDKHDPSVEDKRVAAAMLRAVRQSINEYRDNEWEGLIRQRNRLLRTILLTTLATFVLIALAVAKDVKQEALVVALGFYLVGATVGLIARLRAEGRAGSASDDYGLFEARLLQTPPLSGLAAVGGAVILAISPTLLGGLPASANGATSLEQVFSLDGAVRGVIAAGVFGLSPELLLRWLQRQADDVKKNLESSEAAGGETPAAPSAGAGSTGEAKKK
jgi:hypothetical protein